MGAHRLVQIDRLAERWNMPAADAVLASVSASSGHIYYAYASVVRNDTGDATFVFGTAPNTGPN